MMIQPAVRHQMNRKKTADALRLPELTLGSRAQPAGLVEIAVRLCLNQCKELCPHVWVPILKPLRPCLRPPASHRLPSLMLCQQYVDPLMAFLLNEIPDGDSAYYSAKAAKNKHVVFADSKGLSLTDVRVFSQSEDLDWERACQRPSQPPSSLQWSGAAVTPVLSEDDRYSCAVSTCCPGTRLHLSFAQPSADFGALRRRLAQGMVVLESCAVLTEAAVLRGTARVWNLSFRKDVHVRVTFDSWQSYRDVACVYTQARYGGPQTDIFEFNVPIPKVLDAKKKIEFCLRYLPDGHSQPFWDNNNGQNYGVHVSTSAHLCQDETGKQSTTTYY